MRYPVIKKEASFLDYSVSKESNQAVVAMPVSLYSTSLKCCARA